MPDAERIYHLKVYYLWKSVFSEIKRRSRFRIPVLVLFVIAYQPPGVIPQGDRVHITVVLFVMKFKDAVMIPAFFKPRDGLFYQLLRMRRMAVKKALPDELFSAAFGIVPYRGRVHVKNGMVQGAQHNGRRVLIDHAFEKC